MRTPGDETLTLNRHAGLVPASTAVANSSPACLQRGRSAPYRIHADQDREIIPRRIVAFDQDELPFAWPFLNALFGGDRSVHRVGHLVPDEALDRLAFGEASELTLAMLHHAAYEVGRYADVERAIPAARHDVDARLSLPHLPLPRHAGLVPASTRPRTRRRLIMRHGGPRNKSGVTMTQEHRA